MRISSLVTFMSALLMSFSFVACATPTPPPSSACVDFQGYADNTQMGMTFQVGSLTFTGLGTQEPFVNDITENVHGLQFSDDGIQIDMAGSATTINLVAGSWTGQQLDIDAQDSSGNSVDQATVPGDNSVHSLTLNGLDITSIVIKGGGGEGVLVEICVNGTPPPPPPSACVDFQGYADNTQMGMTFQVGSLTFTGLGTQESFVNDITENVHGLQFADDGIQIDMPGSATTISLVAGSWTGQQLDIDALDSSGNLVDQTTVPGDNSVHSLTLSGLDITSIVIKGGGGEGVLVEICVDGTPPSSACMDFEAPVVVGTQYGQLGGQNPGDVVFTSNGIPVAVYDFVFTNGGGSFNVATIETSSATSFGQGQIANTNNINLEFDFSGLSFQPSEVTADFLDMGGFENLSVNGAPVIAGELAVATVPAGLAINVNTAQVTGGKTGTMTIIGPVKTLRIGGQEFWLDNVCVKD